MAKIGALPAMAIIDAMRGKLDFYKWCDLTIVRKWPRSPGRNRNAAVVAAQGPFIYINKLASQLNEEVINSYKVIATAGGLSWKDYLTRWYINATISTRSIQTDGYKFKEGYPYMKLVILDNEVQVVSYGPTAITIPWTSIDLSPHVSVDATFAYMRPMMQKNNLNLGGDNWLAMRQEAGKQGMLAVKWWTGHEPTFFATNDILVPLDVNKCLEYTVVVAGANQDLFGWIHLLGYIEQV